LRENTIIIFQSDNGYSTEERAHFGGGNAGIYRGSKFSLFEGGIRVPAAISWPLKLKAGEVRDQMAVNADWMPTLAELCDIDLDSSELDGKSLVPIIENQNLKSNHDEGFCWQNGKSWASRKGDWKLLGNPFIAGGTFSPNDSLFLVNLKDDPGESKNLADTHSEKVRQLKIQFEDWLKKNQ